jgi:16S rRNA (guanine527-N7)-methyltransferase
MDTIQKYFNDLSEIQLLQFSKLKELYSFWNSKINVISRKDLDNIYIHHVLHSLSIAEIISFERGAKVLDIGTGGGFPGIPLAIIFPETKFVLIDSIGKKIKVVNEIIRELNLKNAEARQINSLNLNGRFDYIVSRAVSSLPDFYNLAKNLIYKGKKDNLKNGIIYLKGGDITDELNILRDVQKITNISVYNISDYFSESYFETKKIIHIRVY